ncbi:triose-phosphate isomerase [Paralimibaculum aggregatum]|uniref:Triosephosphate isomerase n=1 Tax=Paralimibaculum aggregatum TaxID=3036245 RepID=A0ABQ6LS50_9RHOB|nr:triose-phosphate isomerase [Limibaculum sp. NKW23]GMG84460.1 triose-phosphate isomerase [Limibaculum sp. NKW23]
MTASLIAGNWKMNGHKADLAELDALIEGLGGATAPEVLLCPPATLVAGFAGRAAGSPVAIGGQDCHSEPAGAHTGDISAAMLADAGATAVILGHSERRADHGETDVLVAWKLVAAWAAGLRPILCVGETLEDRDAGRAEAVVARQLAASIPDTEETPAADLGARLVVAYEPVWAIGTGRTAGTADIAAMHGMIRARLAERFGEAGGAVPLLYGGSVKPGNAAEIFALADVDGALVGGASLKAADFLKIIAAAR